MALGFMLAVVGLVCAGCDDAPGAIDASVDLANVCDCAPGYRCQDSLCVLSCQAGLTPCDGANGAATCTNLKTDRANCGACGSECQPGFICAEGQCSISCPVTLTTCGGGDGGAPECTNLQTDPQNCGACAQPCPPSTGSLCVAGKCQLCADGTCRVAFVSSTTSDGNLGGLLAADARCQSLAATAGLLGSYRAWLSSSTISAADRMPHASAPYIRTDGVRIANDWADLTSGFLRATIDHTETGAAAPVTTIVFTGTIRDGTALAPNCADWTDSTSGAMGRTAVIDDIDDEWTNAALSSCDRIGAIYCFQQ